MGANESSSASSSLALTSGLSNEQVEYLTRALSGDVTFTRVLSRICQEEPISALQASAFSCLLCDNEIPVSASAVATALSNFIDSTDRNVWKRIHKAWQNIRERKKNTCAFAIFACAIGLKPWQCSLSLSCPLCISFANAGPGTAAISRWGIANAPQLCQTLKDLVRSRVLGGNALHLHALRTFLPPSCAMPAAAVFGFSMCIEAEEVEGCVLYDSQMHGMSFETLSGKIMGYDGPTALVIVDARDDGAVVAGSKTVEEWDFWVSESALFFFFSNIAPSSYWYGRM